jgi:hypothetical protein
VSRAALWRVVSLEKKNIIRKTRTKKKQMVNNTGPAAALTATISVLPRVPSFSAGVGSRAATGAAYHAIEHSHSLRQKSQLINSPVRLSYHPSDLEQTASHTAVCPVQSSSSLIKPPLQGSYHPAVPGSVQHTGMHSGGLQVQ